MYMTRNTHSIDLPLEDGRYSLVEARFEDAEGVARLFANVRNNKAREMGANGAGYARIDKAGKSVPAIEVFTTSITGAKAEKLRHWERIYRSRAAEASGMVIAGGLSLAQILPFAFRYLVPLFRFCRNKADVGRGFNLGALRYHLYTVQDNTTGEVVGFSSLDGSGKAAEVTYYIEPAHQHKGLARATAQAMIRLGQERCGYEQVRAVIKPGNQASINIAKFLDMSFERRDTAADRRGTREIYSTKLEAV